MIFEYLQLIGNTDLHPHNLNETSTIGNNKIKQLTVINHIKVIYLSLETIVSLSTHQYCQLSQYSCFNNKVRECYAKGAIRIAYEPTETNLADVCTKVLSAPEKKRKMQHILY